ncbi:HNH endonuclease [Streptomyces sp. NPDC049577]|uniref:HNH endonuclease n=1 Tax=Streptomyces sp. NPDC049577 TaxID=3155153 RepID=UPI00341F6FC4
MEDVDPLDVLDDHNWHCHLCARPIPRDVHFLDPEAATVDHVVPLARGGTHTYVNMRPAHRRCNASKNDRCQGDQDAGR